MLPLTCCALTRLQGLDATAGSGEHVRDCAEARATPSWVCDWAHLRGKWFLCLFALTSPVSIGA